jgi:hypothetical protein
MRSTVSPVTMTCHFTLDGSTAPIAQVHAGNESTSNIFNFFFFHEWVTLISATRAPPDVMSTTNSFETFAQVPSAETTAAFTN